jgi:TrmH family RNA methyltransferase
MFSKSTAKYIQSLQHKKFRDEEAVFFAEGPKLVGELLEGEQFVCRQLFALAQWTELIPGALQKSLGDKLVLIKDFELEEISALSKPNMVLGIFEKKKINREPDIRGKITLVLDDIQDPGNLGTIIRIADWYGVENVICSPHTADMYNPKVVQSTMASLQRVNLIYTDILEWLHRHTGIKKYAAALDGEDVRLLNKQTEGIIIIGNESKGIREEVMQAADIKITIPRIGGAESLNAAVATGIILYAAHQ